MEDFKKYLDELIEERNSLKEKQTEVVIIRLFNLIKKRNKTK
jgi:hypothetical protein